MGDSHFFVVEADESDGSFRQYPTSIAVVTSLEPDHIDNWGTEENYVQGFVDFTRGASVQCVILCLDDPGARSLVPYLQDSDVTILTYGTHPGADLRLHDIDASVGSARITTPTSQHLLQLNVPGIHNLLNASAALAVGHYLRVDESGFVDGLSAFRGTARRFQDVGARHEVRIIDDYAHHPTEVEATIAVGRLQPVAGRLIVCFQPHLYSRTKEFAQEFAMALSKADIAVVLDVYPAREEPIEGVTGELIADMLRALGAEVHYVEALADAPQALGALVRPGDLVITMGAGSVTSVGPQLMEVLGEL
jgi:UDP-N-acetylmuramate--alanine ligase